MYVQGLGEDARAIPHHLELHAAVFIIQRERKQKGRFWRVCVCVCVLCCEMRNPFCCFL